LKIIADTAANVLKRIKYDSFGNIIEDTNPSFAIPFGFAGGLHDRDTGLVRFGYRDYDPDTGRWTAKDSIGFAGGDTDMYGYCLNDPVNFIDPFGLINWSAVGKGAIATFGGGGVAVVTGAAVSTTGIGTVGGVPAILGGSAAFGWGVSQMITGFLDNEIPFMGVKEAVIKSTTACYSTQDELLAINALGDMLLTGRTVPSNIGNINSVIQSSQSIYNSGSTIMNAIK
jgi:RHS repeat-associated protein